MWKDLTSSPPYQRQVVVQPVLVQAPGQVPDKPVTSGKLLKQALLFPVGL